MKKITQPKPQSRSMRQPPASGQRPHSVRRQDVMTAVKELIDYYYNARLRAEKPGNLKKSMVSFSNHRSEKRRVRTPCQKKL
jgi:hypothetical protein